ncbi:MULTISPECIES: hypothetical protein [Streptomyces]|uniref:Integrase n=3 Tax=Streptomyces rimosus TaxID=1927 RepID=A0A8A1V6W4_STRR1|nr:MULTISPECIES: hypothetical protein [Streptomyces]KOG73138.1 hypothetical protein ADK78_17995 [Kitasatospora aureofaciens]MYT41994.1 hypothetical protein [Streptomyces sp. SID5471]KOT38680.1 hypothetical protein ADK42_17270 [Streptomyces rimosus subsp. rimosus]KOT38779.1 hypothetical protein ADK84_16515 [Streptomyces sp. NRRL WC-3701]KOT60841.1 hypothetical protein ADK45_18855 [Streptomyces rimosus subsp. rimosus]
MTANGRGVARSCEVCCVWTVMHQRRACAGCLAWRAKHRERGVCPRCRHEANLNSDGLCRSCLQAIRTESDAVWALSLEGAPPRPLQLMVGVYRDKSADARPLRSPATQGVGRGRDRWKSLLNRQRAAADGPAPPVLPAQLTGQLALFTLPRTLTGATATAVADRPVRGWQQAWAAVGEMAAEHGLTGAWAYAVGQMVRLALAVREAEGVRLLPEPMLRDLPANADAVRLVLLQARMLEPAPKPMRFCAIEQPATAYFTAAAAPVDRGPRPCADCQAWMPAGGARRWSRCSPCRRWSAQQPRGRCARCGREDLPLRDDRCRTCHPVRYPGAAPPPAARATQLVIDLPAGVSGPVRRPRAAAVPDTGWDAAARPVAVGCGQQALFPLRRDWTQQLAQVRHRQAGELPLTETDRHLVAEYVRLWAHGHKRGHRADLRTLTLVLHRFGGQAAIEERDVHDLARLDPTLRAKRVCQFLRAHDLLVEDPDRHRDADATWAEARLGTLPGPLAAEVRTWVAVMRGQGRREHPPRSYRTVRCYLRCLLPLLGTWAGEGIATLREITDEHLTTALTGLSGHRRRRTAAALRSLFKALRQENVVFRDPARGLVGGCPTGLPTPVPGNLLAGLLDAAKTPFGRFVVVLAAVHALPSGEIRGLLTADLSLAHATLQVRRGPLRHTLYLEECTHRLAAEWLAYRHRRWPGSANCHLLVSRRTALDPDQPAVAKSTVREVLPKTVSLEQLRQDRLLDEALQSADPLKLMRLFGIGEKTAMHYVAVAHPERTAKLTR